MEYIPVESEVNDIGEGFVLDIGSLYDYLSRLKDYRDARGVRYKLVDILVFIVLAKLAGEDRLSGISEWVWHRREGLCRAAGSRSGSGSSPDDLQSGAVQSGFCVGAGKIGARPLHHIQGEWTVGSGGNRRQDTARQHRSGSQTWGASVGGLRA